MFDTREEHDSFHYASDSELDYAEAAQIGYYHPERAWVCTDRDVWHRNPYYTGPAQPHPYDDEQDEGGEPPVREARVQYGPFDDIPF